MKRRSIAMIIGLMAAALAGLASFQVYWIRHAVDLSKTQFSRNVHESLVTVIDRLENQEAVRLTSSSFIFRDSTQNSYNIRANGKGHSSAMVFTGPDVSTKVEVIVTNDTDVKSNVSADTVIFLNGAGEINRVKLKNKVEVVDQTLTKILRQENKIIEHRVSREKIDSLLHRSLEEQGINLKYNFVVYNEQEDTVVIGDLAMGSSEAKRSPFKAYLFPNDIKHHTNYLSVTFPDQQAFILRDIWMTLIAGILLMGIIIGCFTYTIRIIRRQKRLSEIKNDFINNMTHEFKTPLATVSLATQFLRETRPSSEQKYLEVIAQENKRLSNQVEKVLQAAMMDKQEFRIERIPVDLSVIAREVVDKFSIHVDKKAIQLEIGPGDHCFYGDKDHLNHTLTNLVDNAIKYSPHGIRVAIRTCTEKDRVVITIEDSGIGMKKDVLKRIFDRFYRASTGDVHDVKGFGLGLSYVRKIVELHGGTIDVESEPGNGSTFRIIFYREK